MKTLIIFSFLLNGFLYLFNYKLAELLNLYDHPDNLRKLHKNKVPLTGGVIIFLNLLTFYIFNLYNSELDLFPGITNLDLFMLSCTILWVVGIIDDKIDIPPNTKFLVTLLVIIVNLYFDKSIAIDIVNLSFLNSFDIGNFSYFWTLLCFLLFINAFNMFDGINLQTSIYSATITIFFILKGYLVIVFLMIIFGLTMFSLLNYRNRSFMGDNGTYLVSFIFSYFFITLYKNTSLIIYADEIVLIMLVPGLDLMRLFVSRLLRNKNPFSSDRNHLHHILLKHYTQSKTIIIIHSLIIIPLLISAIYGNFLMMLICTFIIYTIIIIKLR